MNSGRISIIAMLLSAVAVGGGIWYAQEYAYYSGIAPGSPEARLSITTRSGPKQIDLSVFDGIDAASSPVRWRVCGRMDTRPVEPIPYEDPQPLNAPRWFECFDALQIGEDLADGKAIAVLGVSQIRPDVDRVFAIYPDGRIYGWHQYDPTTSERGVMN